jgi:hydrogenase-4 component C
MTSFFGPYQNTIGLILIGLFQMLLILLLAPLFTGLVRVLRARVQNRVGPPVTQNYRDIAKLMKRQEVISEQAGWAFRFTPYLVMASMLLAALIIPMLTVISPLIWVGDLIFLIYLFALPRFFFALAGLESGSPFGGIGAKRELLLSALVEPVMLLVVFIMALLAGSTNLSGITGSIVYGDLQYSMAVLLGLVAFAFALFVEMGRLPFDLAEAEQELQEGPLAEYSGRSLALMKWGLGVRQVVLAALFLAMFFPFGVMTELTLGSFVVALLAFLVKLILIFAGLAVLENVMARVRYVKAPLMTWLSLGAALLSLVFYLVRV